MTEVEELNADDFEELLFEKFHVLRPDHDVPTGDTIGGGNQPVGCKAPELKLVEVDRLHRLRRLDGNCSERNREPFALLFRGSHENDFVSHIHTLVNEKLGAI